MPQYSFGTGSLFAVRTDQTVPTPVQFGALQDVSVEVSFTQKELYGQYQFPIAIGRGQGKVTGKAKFAQINGATLNGLFFGQSSTAGQLVTVLKEALTIPSGGGTLTVSGGTAFVDDLGVISAAGGGVFQRVASSPLSGQYTVSAGGVYGFSGVDGGGPILISYTEYATGGTRVTLANQPLSAAPTFRTVLSQSYQGKTLTLSLNQCIASKLNFAVKKDDFTIPEFDFSAFADGNQTLGLLSVSE